MENFKASGTWAKPDCPHRVQVVIIGSGGSGSPSPKTSLLTKIRRWLAKVTT